MAWFKRNKEGITTSTEEKKETPEGLWVKCTKCKTVFTADDFKKNSYVCNRCSHHEKIGSEEYFDLIFDKGKFTEFDKKLSSGDPLKFSDTKKYTDRVKNSETKTGLKDAIRTAKGKLDGKKTLLGENQSIHIPLGSKHRLSNPGKLSLELIEVQSGAYLNEDDIVRFEDKFNRK